MAARRKASSFTSASSPSGGRDDSVRPDAARIEAVGALLIALVGVPLHFLYSSTQWAAIGWLGPVNESVWEHFKLAFWPGILFALLARRLYAQKPPNYWAARLLSLSATPALIALIFYASRALAPGAGLAVDILNFFFSVAVAQWLGWRALGTRLPWGTEAAALAVIALLCAVFAVFSYRPPALELFRSPVGYLEIATELSTSQKV